MYTIKTAAELTGVSEATLRAWERRYGVVEPIRTPSGYRLYDEKCIGLLARMRHLIEAGWAVREAAREIRSIAEQDQRPVPPPEPTTSLLSDAPVSAVDAAARLDPMALAFDIEQQFGSDPFEQVVDSWLMPTVQRLGRGWQDGAVSVAGEHLASNAIMRLLGRAFDAAPGQAGGRRVLVGLPAGCRHEIGAMAFAVASRRAGLDVSYLGADLPTIEWAAAARTLRADAAVLAVPHGSDLITAHAAVRAIAEAAPDTVIAVGGGAQEDLPPPAVCLGHEIAPAAARLRSLLERPRPAHASEQPWEPGRH